MPCSRRSLVVYFYALRRIDPHDNARGAVDLAVDPYFAVVIDVGFKPDAEPGHVDAV